MRREEEGRGRRDERRNAIVWTNTKVQCRLSIPEEVLGPHNAVNGFTGCVAYGTARERLGSWLWLAFITLTYTLQRRTLDTGLTCEVNMVNGHLAYDGHLPKVASIIRGGGGGGRITGKPGREATCSSGGSPTGSGFTPLPHQIYQKPH